jgi:hypothetical protein
MEGVTVAVVALRQLRPCSAGWRNWERACIYIARLHEASLVAVRQIPPPHWAAEKFHHESAVSGTHQVCRLQNRDYRGRCRSKRVSTAEEYKKFDPLLPSAPLPSSAVSESNHIALHRLANKRRSKSRRVPAPPITELNLWNPKPFSDCGFCS